MDKILKLIANNFFIVFTIGMKINKCDSNEIQVQKMLFNVQRYIDKPHFKDTIKTERLARDLYAVGQKCKETEKGNILTEYTKEAIKEIEKLIDKLPLGYIAEHPEMESAIRFVRQNNY